MTKHNMAMLLILVLQSSLKFQPESNTFEILNIAFIQNSFSCFEKISQCSPGTHYVDQSSFKLTKTTCLYLLSSGIKGVGYYAQLFRSQPKLWFSNE